MSTIRASHILVSTREEADDIRKTITTGGKSFADAARENSECPSSEAGGDLGWFGKGMMVKPFEEAAFSLPVGQVSQPVETQFGYHLIVVTEKR